MESSIKEALKRKVSSDPKGVIATLEKAGIQLSSQEKTSIQSGSIDSFSDSQLDQRFNAKVLGMMGMMGSSSSSSSSSSSISSGSSKMGGHGSSSDSSE